MLLVVKARNALELFWDSLDAQERQVVAYMAVYMLVAAVTALQRVSRERLKRELREELHAHTG
jgi:ABC-type branched-subunit amino acid transport system substrate-binding protein